MYKKLNNKERKEAVNLYYKENNDITIKEYCTIIVNPSILFLKSVTPQAR